VTQSTGAPRPHASITPGHGALPPVRNADTTAYLENAATLTDAKP